MFEDSILESLTNDTEVDAESTIVEPETSSQGGNSKQTRAPDAGKSKI
jgi:hypothetical protein